MRNGLQAEKTIFRLNISNLEIIKEVESVFRQAMPYDITSRRPGDLSRLYADPTKAKEILGFVPEHSDLRNIIETAWRFHAE